MFSAKPKKRFGQNFLQDQLVVKRAIAAAELIRGECVLEVGPGRGVLTQALLEAGCRVLAVEIDRNLAEELRRKFGDNPNFTLIVGDVLKVPDSLIFQGNVPPRVFICNLPYNISAPFFFWITKRRRSFRAGVLLLQEEFAQRLIYCQSSERLSSKAYGALSVVADLCYQIRYLCSVPPHSFSPAPKVQSALLHFSPKTWAIPAGSEEEFFAAVRQLFAGRRKQLRKKLDTLFPAAIAGYAQERRVALQNKRCEDLSPADFVELYTRNYQEQLG